MGHSEGRYRPPRPDYIQSRELEGRCRCCESVMRKVGESRGQLCASDTCSEVPGASRFEISGYMGFNRGHVAEDSPDASLQ